MITVIASLKGGVGKTALTAYLAFETGTPVITNQHEYPELPHILPDGACMVIDSEAEEFPEIPDDMNVIIDCNNHIDQRLKEVLKIADHVIVPMTYGVGNMYRSIATIKEVLKYCSPDKVLIVGNCKEIKKLTKEERAIKKDKKLKGQDDPVYIAIKDEVTLHFPKDVYNEFTFFPVAASVAFSRIIEEKAAIREIMRGMIAANTLPKQFFNRMYSPLIEQMDDIIEYLKLA